MDGLGTRLIAMADEWRILAVGLSGTARTSALDRAAAFDQAAGLAVATLEASLTFVEERRDHQSHATH
jgi:hypothetical protein